MQHYIKEPSHVAVFYFSGYMYSVFLWARESKWGRRDEIHCVRGIQIQCLTDVIFHWISSLWQISLDDNWMSLFTFASQAYWQSHALINSPKCCDADKPRLRWQNEVQQETFAQLVIFCDGYKKYPRDRLHKMSMSCCGLAAPCPNPIQQITQGKLRWTCVRDWINYDL